MKMYEGDKYAFMAILPLDKEISINDYVKGLPDDAFNKFYNSMYYTDVDTLTPAFTFDYSTNMNNMLQSLGMTKAFNKNAIPSFKKVFGKQVTIKMYDMDATSTKTHYDTAINRLADFDQEYYGMGPFIDIEGYFSYLGYRAGDEEAIAKDIHNSQYDKKLTSTLEGHRFSYKS